MPYHCRQVTILGRKNGSEENIINVTCDIFDMSAYVDALRKCLNYDAFDYLIIEPYRLKSLFPDEVY